MTEGMNDGRKERMCECRNGGMKEGMNEGMEEGMNEWMNEYMND